MDYLSSYSCVKVVPSASHKIGLNFLKCEDRFDVPTSHQEEGHVLLVAKVTVLDTAKGNSTVLIVVE